MVKWTKYAKSQLKNLYDYIAEQLYCEERVTLGRVAKMAGMSYAKFAEHLSASGIAVVDYPPEDLEDELKVLSLSQLG